jgi:hypothetical protein
VSQQPPSRFLRDTGPGAASLATRRGLYHRLGRKIVCFRTRDCSLSNPSSFAFGRKIVRFRMSNCGFADASQATPLRGIRELP